MTEIQNLTWRKRDITRSYDRRANRKKYEHVGTWAFGTYSVMKGGYKQGYSCSTRYASGLPRYVGTYATLDAAMQGAQDDLKSMLEKHVLKAEA